MGAIIGIVGGPQVFSSANGGKIYAYNNMASSANTTVAPVNTSRQKILFHNPGDVDQFISPVLAAQSGPSGPFTTLVPTTGALGGTFRVFANGGTLEISGECQGAWQCLAASGIGKPLTVMDSNIG